jgi:exopolysaccharide biosynthesis protein
VDSDTGQVLVLVVDGRSAASRGYTMVELADLMSELGADEAINLDGGGSSTMVARNQQGRTAVLNHPSDGFQRRVSNSLVVRYSKPGS